MKHLLVKMVFIVALNILLSSPTRTASVYVSSASTAANETPCGSKANPCRTIQGGINNAKANSKIIIIASETPYKDCPITFDKPLTFTGTQGIPVVDCEGKKDAFKIEVSLKKLKKKTKLVVVMSGLKIRNAKTAIFYGGMPDKTIVQISNLIFEENGIDVHMKNLDLCSLTMKNVIARGSQGDGIRFESCKKSEAQLTNCEFHGKYLNVVSTRFALTLAMVNVKFDMKTRRPDAVETRSPVHVETAGQATSITVSKSSQFLNHAGRRHGIVSIEGVYIKGVSPPRNATVISIHAQFTDVTFVNNSVSAGNGSAFSYSSGSVSSVIFRKCLFRENSAFLGGGALWLEHVKAVVLDDCVFSRNRAYGDGKGQGGAIFASKNGRMEVTNCSFQGNSASKRGGALYVNRGRSMMIKNGIFGNDRDSRDVTLGDVMYVIENNLRFKGKVIFDLQSANSRKPIIWFLSEKYILWMNNQTQFTCPKGYHYEQVDTTLIRKGVYHFFAFTCAPCHDQFYSVSRGYHMVNGTDFSGKCKSCPHGALCDGTIRARQNFWGALRGDEIEMIPCPRGYCCNREPCNGHESCAKHRTGTLCGRCEDGFSEGVSSAVCHPNESCRSWYLVILLSCTLILFAILLFEQDVITFLSKFLLWNDKDVTTEYRLRAGSIEEDEDNNRERMPIGPSVNAEPDYTRVPEDKEYNNTGGYIKSFIYFYQVVYLLGISSNASRDDFPNGVVESLMPFLNLQFGDVFTADCLFENLTPVSKTLFKSSVCFFLFSYCFLSYLLYSLIRRWKFGDSSSIEDEPAYKSISYPVRLTGAIMQIILLSYTALTQLTFRLLHCVKIGDHHVLQIDGSIVCYEFSQDIIWLLFSVYIVSFPFVLIFGRHLLLTDRLSPKRFLVACIFPTIFLSYWIFQYVIRGEFRQRSTPPPGRNPHRDKILYILQYSYRESPENNRTWRDKMVENWESVLMFRRLVLVSVFIFADSFLLRSYLHFVFSFIFLLHHFFSQPFVNARANVFETISLSTLMLFSGFGIAEASFSAAGEVPPPLIVRTIAARDYLIALFPFVILVIILAPRIKHHLAPRILYHLAGSRSPSFQSLDEEHDRI